MRSQKDQRAATVSSLPGQCHAAPRVGGWKTEWLTRRSKEEIRTGKYGPIEERF